MATTCISAMRRICACSPGFRSSSTYSSHTHVTRKHPLSTLAFSSMDSCLVSSKFDLYTKTADLPDVEALKPYYQSLIDKYCPGILKWWPGTRTDPGQTRPPPSGIDEIYTFLYTLIYTEYTYIYSYIERNLMYRVFLLYNFLFNLFISDSLKRKCITDIGAFVFS